MRLLRGAGHRRLLTYTQTPVSGRSRALSPPGLLLALPAAGHPEIRPVRLTRIGKCLHPVAALPAHRPELARTGALVGTRARPRLRWGRRPPAAAAAFAVMNHAEALGPRHAAIGEGLSSVAALATNGSMLHRTHLRPGAGPWRQWPRPLVHCHGTTSKHECGNAKRNKFAGFEDYTHERPLSPVAGYVFSDI